MLTYAMLRIGGVVDFVRCHPSEVEFLKHELNGFVIGEGCDGKEAAQDARQAGLLPTK